MRRNTRERNGFVYAVAIVNAAAGTVLSFAPAVFSFLKAASRIFWTISTTTLRQSATPTEMVGRVSAMIVATTIGARTVGAVLGADIAKTLGLQWGPLPCLVGMVLQLPVILRPPLLRAWMAIRIPPPPSLARSSSYKHVRESCAILREVLSR